MSFQDFVSDWVTPSNVQSWVHFRPQTWFLQSVESSEKLDFIGRVESFEQDMSVIEKRLGNRVSTETRNVGELRKADFRAEYTEEMWQRVGEVYRSDVESLGYEFSQKNRMSRLSRSIVG